MPKPADIPACPEAPSVQSPARVVREYDISLVTPLFGGGAEAGIPDESLPIRGTSIRGQLRYWWRIVIGHQLGSRMWQREEEVFGSTDFPSPLRVHVAEQPRILPVDPGEYGSAGDPAAYALFSAIESGRQVAREGPVFRLQLAWDDAQGLQSRRRGQNAQRKKEHRAVLPEVVQDIGLDIIEALRAWCTFGGLGARSRRGCGAVFCQELASALPHLPGSIYLAPPQSNAVAAWKESVKAYRNFRQSPRGKKHQKVIGPKTVRVPGRSHWPEADSIRKITGSSLKPPPGTPSNATPADENSQDHSVPVVPEHLLPAFPRAILGLPINFHFADSPGKTRPGRPYKDPQDVQLTPVLPDGVGGSDRMLAPAITRPLWHQGKWHPAVVIIKPSIPSGLKLKLIGERARADGGDLSYDLPIDRVVNSSFGVLRPMRSYASALSALADFLKETGFTEVVP